MALITLDRTLRLVWTGNPFAGLKSFSHNGHLKMTKNYGGSPATKSLLQQITQSSSPDIVVDAGSIGIQQFQSCEWAFLFGPFQIEGEDNNDYDVWCSDPGNIMLAEQEEITLELTWYVTQVV